MASRRVLNESEIRIPEFPTCLKRSTKVHKKMRCSKIKEDLECRIPAGYLMGTSCVKNVINDHLNELSGAGSEFAAFTGEAQRGKKTDVF